MIYLPRPTKQDDTFWPILRSGKSSRAVLLNIFRISHINNRNPKDSQRDRQTGRPPTTRIIKGHQTVWGRGLYSPHQQGPHKLVLTFSAQATLLHSFAATTRGLPENKIPNREWVNWQPYRERGCQYSSSSVIKAERDVCGKKRGWNVSSQEGEQKSINFSWTNKRHWGCHSSAIKGPPPITANNKMRI